MVKVMKTGKKTVMKVRNAMKSKAKASDDESYSYSESEETVAISKRPASFVSESSDDGGDSESADVTRDKNSAAWFTSHKHELPAVPCRIRKPIVVFSQSCAHSRVYYLQHHMCACACHCLWA
jgi:hypothetical protein